MGVAIGVGASAVGESAVERPFCLLLFFPELFPDEELFPEERLDETGVSWVAELVEVIHLLLDMDSISGVGKALLLCSMLTASSTKGAGLKYSL